MNPLLLLKFGPYVVIALLAAALGVQSLRLTSAEQEFVQYKQDQTTQRQEAKDAADKQRNLAGEAFAVAKQKLESAVARGDAYRRCVAAGKCARVQQPAACPASSVPTTDRADDRIAQPVPPATGDAAINDCAVTTLMLNQLQADIEAQPGYKE